MTCHVHLTQIRYQRLSEPISQVALSLDLANAAVATYTDVVKFHRLQGFEVWTG
jgi:hypothetical protein